MSADGPINQTAYVVDDIDAAIDYWTTVMAVGPFFRLPRIAFAMSDYLGKDQPITFEAAFSWSGGIIVELIQPIGPSIFADFKNSGGRGVHHLARFVTDLEASARDIENLGGRRIQGGSFADGSKIAYFDMGGDQGIVLELAQLSPEILDLFATVKDASANWDGKTRLLEI